MRTFAGIITAMAGTLIIISYSPSSNVNWYILVIGACVIFIGGILVGDS